MRESASTLQYHYALFTRKSAMTTRVFCAGCVVVDEVFRLPHLPAGDGKFFAVSRRRTMGGMAAAAAATVVGLGGRAALWAPVGDDAEGKFLLDEIVGAGVDSLLVRRRQCATAFSTVCMDDDGGRMIVNFAPPALYAPPQKMPSLRGVKAVLADIRWLGGAAAALESAQKAGIPSVLDWETAPPAASSDRLLMLARLATCVVFSHDGLRQFCKAAKKPFRTERALREAATIMGAAVAMTRGADGVIFLREDFSAGIISTPAVTANNTLGAGDAFHGALALALAEGQDFESGLMFATAAAAAKCTKPVGQYPRRREISRLLRQIRTP